MKDTVTNLVATGVIPSAIYGAVNVVHQMPIGDLFKLLVELGIGAVYVYKFIRNEIRRRRANKNLKNERK